MSLRFYCSTILIFCLLSSCSLQKALNIDEEIYGTWDLIGYGYQLRINQKYTLLFDTYESGCNLNSKFRTALLEDYYEIVKLREDKLCLKQGFTEYNFVRCLESNACTNSLNINNPLTNFDALWETFNENYAFFDLREVDWSDLKDKYRKRLSEESTDLELYTVLNEMILELNDGHASIDVPESLEDQIEEKDDVSDELRAKVIYKILEKYLPEFRTYNRGMINWGLINDDISYIQFNDFEDLANYGISDELSPEEFAEEYWDKADKSANYDEDVLKSFEKQMEVIYEDIKNSKACIIDIRFNGGGYDEVGLEILSYFIKQPVLAFSKKARFGEGFTESQDVYIKPKGNQFEGSLYILTSFQTASASETFVLASQNIENSIRVGSNTEGILSDILSKRLPKGWEYSLSNEIYENADGTNYEGIGIPADYSLAYSREAIKFYNDLLIEEKDIAIEKAIELILNE